MILPWENILSLTAGPNDPQTRFPLFVMTVIWLLLSVHSRNERDRLDHRVPMAHTLRVARLSPADGHAIRGIDAGGASWWLPRPNHLSTWDFRFLRIASRVGKARDPILHKRVKRAQSA